MSLENSCGPMRQLKSLIVIGSSTISLKTDTNTIIPTVVHVTPVIVVQTPIVIVVIPKTITSMIKEGSRYSLYHIGKTIIQR